MRDPRPTGSLNKAADSRIWVSRHVEAEQTTARKGFFQWWLSWTAPDMPPADASAAKRTAARRGRFVSLIMLAYLAFCIPITIFIFTNFDRLVFLGNLIAILAGVGLLLLNRRGLTSFTSIIVIILLDMGAIVPLLTSKGLSPFDLPTYDLLVISELLAAALFPGWGVFFVAAFHCIFIILSFSLQPHSVSLQPLMDQYSYGLIMRPLILQILTAIFTYLWTRNVGQATNRADRAEVIAALQHDIAQQGQEIALQKQQLETSIKQILETQIRAANGDLNARVPLTRDNVLWEVGGSLNNLLSRMQRMRQDSQELQRLKEDIARLVHTLRTIRNTRSRAPLTPSGTPVDTIRQELVLLEQLPPASR